MKAGRCLSHQPATQADLLTADSGSSGGVSLSVEPDALRTRHGGTLHAGCGVFGTVIPSEVKQTVEQWALLPQASYEIKLS